MPLQYRRDSFFPCLPAANSRWNSSLAFHQPSNRVRGQGCCQAVLTQDFFKWQTGSAPTGSTKSEFHKHSTRPVNAKAEGGPCRVGFFVFFFWFLFCFVFSEFLLPKSPQGQVGPPPLLVASGNGDLDGKRPAPRGRGQGSHPCLLPACLGSTLHKKLPGHVQRHRCSGTSGINTQSRDKTRINAVSGG